MSQTRDLRRENKQLQESLEELQQKKHELELRLDKILSDIKEKSNDQVKSNLTIYNY